MLTLHPDMVLWQKWCFIASMESLIFYLTLVLLVPLSIHCAVKPASAEEDLRNQEEIKEFGKLTLLWESSSYGLNEEFKYTKIPVNIWGLSGLVSSVLFPFPVLTQSWLLMLVNFLQHGSCCICNSIAVWMENIFTYKLLLLQWKLFGSLCGCTVGCSTDQNYWIVIFTNIESLDIVWGFEKFKWCLWIIVVMKCLCFTSSRCAQLHTVRLWCCACIRSPASLGQEEGRWCPITCGAAGQLHSTPEVKLTDQHTALSYSERH